GEHTPLVSGGEALTPGNRHRGAAAELCVTPWIGVRQRLFEEEQAIWLDGPHYCLGHAEVPRHHVIAHVPVHAEPDVHANMTPHELGLAALEVGCLRSAGRHEIHRPVRCLLVRTSADLETAEAKREVEVDLGGGPCERVVAGATGRISGERVVLAAAEQLVHRDAVHLAFQIPEGRFDAVDNGHPESNPTPVVSGLIHPPPELGDVLDTLANEDG